MRVKISPNIFIMSIFMFFSQPTKIYFFKYFFIPDGFNVTIFIQINVMKIETYSWIERQIDR